MKTEIILPTEENIYYVAQALKKGEVISVPTETVYGLAASIFCRTSILKIFEIKNRPLKKPLSCNISSLDMVNSLTNERSFIFNKLAENFWPGPLTIVVSKNEQVFEILNDKKKTIGIRFSSNKILNKLTNLVGAPLAIPSANISAKKSPTSAREVYDMLKGRVKIILDGGESKFKLESTIVYLKDCGVKILRQGVITKSSIIKAGIKLI